MAKYFIESGREVRKVIKENFGTIPMKISVKTFPFLGTAEVEIKDERVVGTSISSNRNRGGVTKNFIVQKDAKFTFLEKEFMKFLSEAVFVLK